MKLRAFSVRLRAPLDESDAVLGKLLRWLDDEIGNVHGRQLLRYACSGVCSCDSALDGFWAPPQFWSVTGGGDPGRQRRSSIAACPQW